MSMSEALSVSLYFNMLCHKKALSDQASSLAPDWIPLLWRSRILASFMAQQQPFNVMGPDAIIFVLWMLSFKSAFSCSSFTFIKRLFSYLLFAIRVVSSAYLRLLIFLLAILIPACASSSLAFHMMYSALEVKCKPVMRGIQVKRQNSHWRRRSLGI